MSALRGSSAGGRLTDDLVLERISDSCGHAVGGGPAEQRFFTTAEVLQPRPRRARLPRARSLDATVSPVGDDDELNAVLAHGLLGNLHVIQSVLSLLASDRVAIEERPKLQAMAESQIDLMVDVLRDMARGLPADVVEFLDQQRAEH